MVAPKYRTVSSSLSCWTNTLAHTHLTIEWHIFRLINVTNFRLSFSLINLFWFIVISIIFFVDSSDRVYKMFPSVVSLTIFFYIWSFSWWVAHFGLFFFSHLNVTKIKSKHSQRHWPILKWIGAIQFNMDDVNRCNLLINGVQLNH